MHLDRYLDTARSFLYMLPLLCRSWSVYYNYVYFIVRTHKVNFDIFVTYGTMIMLAHLMASATDAMTFANECDEIYDTLVSYRYEYIEIYFGSNGSNTTIVNFTPSNVFIHISKGLLLI